MKKSKPCSSKFKISDNKQRKILNFFTVTKEESIPVESKQHHQVNEIKIKLENNDQTQHKGDLSSRSYCERLCVKCLRKSPSNESVSCNNCNSSPLKSNDVVELKLGGIKPVNESLKVNVKSLVSTNSPDIIPPTPPTVKNKRKIESSSSKTVKRKCNFFDSAYNNIQISKNIESKSNHVEINYTSKIYLSQEKENIKSSENKNLICSSLSYPINKEDVCSTPVNIETDNRSIPEAQKNNISPNLVIEYPGLPLSIVKENNKESFGENLRSDNTSDNNCQEYFIGSTTGGKNNEYHPNSVNSMEIENSLNSFKNSNRKEKEPCKAQFSKQNQLSPNIIDYACENSNLETLSTSKEVNIIYDEQNNQTPNLQFSSKETEDISASFLDNLSLDEDIFEESLKLDNSVRCKVMSVEHLETSGEMLLTLNPCNSTDSAVCVLRGSWVRSVVSVGDIVSVTAKPLQYQKSCWVIDNDYGLLVTHPDTLISGTTVVGSLFCMRRSVLSDMYRGIDSDSPIMVIGSALHELLQEVLKRKVYTLDGIKGVINDFISSRHFIFSLYSSGMSLEKAKETIHEFIPKIHDFVQKYIASNTRKTMKLKTWNDIESWGGTITDVADIEENVWAPKIGVKGKVDVTVKTCLKNKEKVMPLELKTGRASFSAEHRGQVILYAMMMSELGQSVDSGLLLYLREGVMKEVPAGSVERRDLMLLRNQLVTELRASHQVVMNNDQQIAPPVLPRPIHHHSACAKCPYLTICSAALRVSESKQLSEGNPLQGLSVVSTAHLKSEHILYVFHWTGLLRLEHIETHLGSSELHDIWNLLPEIRKKRGTCVPSVKLVGSVIEVTAGSYEHVFEWSNHDSENNETADTLRGFAEGDYIIVSSSSRPAVAAGPIRHINHNQLTLHLERDLSVRQKGENTWHLDKYESQSGLVFNMTNLACLLDNTEQADRLRKAVIRLELPSFKPKLSSRVLKASMDLVATLNEQQRKAIFRALAADHYILIKGMPGTGKTATIVALVQLAVRLGHSVLITSHTHSAVDNVLLRLRGHVDFLRLGSTHKLHPELVEYGETKHKFSSPDDIHTFYNSKSVVAVTCLGSSHPLLARRQFDFCLVDEATQVLQSTVLRPLFSAHKFILIGDPNQLPPLVRSSKAKQLGLGQSLFMRLDRVAVTSELSLQYRMNQCITELANTLTYGGKLQCANPSVSTATLTLPSTLSDEPEWLIRVLSSSLDQSVMVLDMIDAQAVNCVNIMEADIVIKILLALKKAGVPEDRVGVISPYRAQVELLRKQVKSLNSLVEVNTVDQYQGRDKDVILYSCTQSKKPKESDILGDKSRLTVAITRARHKLVIIGNVSLLRGYALFNTIFCSLPNNCIIPVS